MHAGSVKKIQADSDPGRNCPKLPCCKDLRGASSVLSELQQDTGVPDSAFFERVRIVFHVMGALQIPAAL